MLSDEQIRSDLAKLRDIVKAHKAPEADLAIHQEEIDGISYEVFSKAPRNLFELYKPVSYTHLTLPTILRV